jgi:hypothetical protein
MQVAAPRGVLRPWVVSPVSATDCLAALSGAASSRGGVVLLNGGGIMSPYTREWLLNERWHSPVFAIVGGYDAQPALAEWMIDKAVHR